VETGEILARISAFVAETFYREPGRSIPPGEPLVSSGLIDSFGLVDLSLFLEREFGARVDASELGSGRADTLAEIADLVARHRP
jgi:acyl carrier protein